MLMTRVRHPVLDDHNKVVHAYLSTLVYSASLSCVQAEGLEGNEKSTHPFVRIQVEDQSQLTSVQWNKLDPEWDETLTFKWALLLEAACLPPRLLAWFI